MQWFNGLDPTDRNILRILSFYEALDPLQLWYELGEMDSRVDRITREEVSDRLESLRSEGFVERIMGGQEDGSYPAQPKYRLKPDLAK